MEKKVEKELQKAQGDLKEAISAEKDRAASTSELKNQSEDLEDSMGALRTESKAAKNRLWWKSAKWIAIAGVLIFLIFSILFLYLAGKVKNLIGSKSSSNSSDTDENESQ